MDRDQLELLTRQLMAKARDNLTRDGVVAFGILLFTKNNLIRPLLPITPNGADKEALATYLKRHAHLLSAIFLISEAWTLVGDDSQQLVEQYDGGQSLATHPNRKEGLFVTGQSLAGQFTLTHLFDRDKDGAPTNVREHSASWMSTSDLRANRMGRLSGLFL